MEVTPVEGEDCWSLMGRGGKSTLEVFRDVGPKIVEGSWVVICRDGLSLVKGERLGHHYTEHPHPSSKLRYPQLFSTAPLMQPRRSAGLEHILSEDTTRPPLHVCRPTLGRPEFVTVFPSAQPPQEGLLIRKPPHPVTARSTPMETLATDISSGLTEDIDVSTIAESAVDAVIDALRSDMDSTGQNAKPSTLLDVDREMDVVVVARELFSSILARRIAALRRQHNAMLPINKLPAELLASIISISVHSQTWSIAALSQLASVCSRWWRIIITTPSLWTTARMFKQPELALKKSKGLPITVRVQDWHHSEGEMKQFMEIVGPQSHRWQFVFIQTPFTDLLTSHLGRPLLQLEGLSLGYHGGWGGSSKHLALGAIPKLRHLRLTRITLDWRMLTQISLETLSLRNLIQGYVPKLRELYQILASSPRLTSLTLCELGEAADAGEFQGEPLFLTRLRTTEISDVGEQTAIGLVNLLRAENLQELTVLVQMQASSKVSDFQALLRPSQRSGLLSSALRNQGWKVVYAKVGPESLELGDKVIVGGATPGLLSFRISGALGSQLLVLLGGHDRGYNIDLDITESGLRGEDLNQVLRPINPSVLRIGSDHIAPTMMGLSTKPPPSQKWFCPNLGEVHLMSTSLDLNKIAKTLRVRNGLVETVGRSRLSVYNAAGEVFVARTVSFKPKSGSSQGTSAQQNVK